MTPVALITGAGKRIGQCVARSMHSQGYNVVAHYNRSRADAELLCEELNQKRGNSAAAIGGDLLDEAAIKGLAEQAQAQWGRLDVLVNNASSYFPTPLDTLADALDKKQWNDLVGSNLKAPLLLSSACAKALAQQQGCIINIIDSNVLSKPIENHPIYTAAKAGLHGLTLSLAKDFAPQVRVNGVAPGAILWAANERDEATQQAIIKATALGRLGAAEDIANAVLFLAQASYITGYVMKVDGGKNIR